METGYIIQKLTENKVTLENINTYKNSYGINIVPKFVTMDRVFTFQIILFIAMFLFLGLTVSQIFKSKDSFTNSALIVVSMISTSIFLVILFTSTGLAIPRHSIVSVEDTLGQTESGYYMVDSFKENSDTYTLNLIGDYDLESGEIVEPLSINASKEDFDIKLVYNADENSKKEYSKFINYLNK